MWLRIQSVFETTKRSSLRKSWLYHYIYINCSKNHRILLHCNNDLTDDTNSINNNAIAFHPRPRVRCMWTPIEINGFTDHYLTWIADFSIEFSLHFLWLSSLLTSTSAQAAFYSLPYFRSAELVVICRLMRNVFSYTHISLLEVSHKASFHNLVSHWALANLSVTPMQHIIE